MSQPYRAIWHRDFWRRSILRRDPWPGSEKKPPELDKVIADLLRKLRKLLNGDGDKRPYTSQQLPATSNSSFLALVFCAVIIVIWAALGFFIVKPAEEAVILRFGQYVGTAAPGPHWVPRGIESYTKVNIQQVSSFSFGADYLTQSSDDENQQQSIPVENAYSAPVSDVDDDTDKNVVNAELSVQYRIVDPKQYLFNIVGGATTLEQAASAALSEVIGAMRLNSVLTVGRDRLTLDVKTHLQAMMDSYQAGIEVVAVNVRKVQAPEEVADAFLDVVQAGQDEQRYIQQAQAYARKVIPIAEGGRNRILAQAQAYQQEVILNSQADVASYLALLSVYQQAPVITKDRMYLEMMQEVLSNTSKILLDTKQSNNLINLPLDQFFSLSKNRAAINLEKAPIVDSDKSALEQSAS
ncbi:MAG: FtsH protease activity modulator HflK [Gammaproteobacteria bacterium]|nr:FtsH protease activity modulator HflK [Gammaproteobacteria bacterium]